MNPNIGITDDYRHAVVGILNTLLADEYLLYTKTRNYHWNVVGPQFNDLHSSSSRSTRRSTTSSTTWPSAPARSAGTPRARPPSSASSRA
jgi:Ferritin-like domain